MNTTLPVRACQYCGQEFQPVRRMQRFCSPAHRKLGWEKTLKGQARKKRANLKRPHVLHRKTRKFDARRRRDKYLDNFGCYAGPTPSGELDKPRFRKKEYKF